MTTEIKKAIKVSIKLLLFLLFIALGCVILHLWRETMTYPPQLSQLSNRINELQDQIISLQPTINLHQATTIVNHEIEDYPYSWPVVVEDYRYISSYFGDRFNPLAPNTGSLDLKYHPALDLVGVEGARLQAVADGIVINKWNPAGAINGIHYKGHANFNGYLQIEMSNGWIASYGHISHILVREGDRVVQGQSIARINPIADAKSTGPHVHFTLQNSNGKFIQSQNYCGGREND